MVESVGSENRSGFTPFEYNVLIQPRKVETRTKGGLLKPEEYVEREQWGETSGIVLAMSALAFDYETGAPKPQIGDMVVFPKAAGTTIKGADGETYRVIKDKDVIGIMEAAHG